VRQLLFNDGSQAREVKGVITLQGKEYLADIVVVAAGAWTPFIVPHLKDFMAPTGQIVFHFQPENPNDFMGPSFPTYLADSTQTGFYGFPAHPKDGRVKVGHHGPGHKMRNITADGIQETLIFAKENSEREFRRFILQSVPKLADSPAIYSRMCLYCDTFDGDFLIDYDPHIAGLVIASGGSGHGFKFGPVLGDLIADVVEKKPNKFQHKFKYREVSKGKKEQSRRTRGDLQSPYLANL